MIDTHAHLNAEIFADDRAEVIARAEENGVSTIINVGVDFETSQECLDIAREYPSCYAAIGAHPYCASSSTDIEWIRDLVFSEKVVAIGEIGLDDHGKGASLTAQSDLFRQQLGLAKEYSLPAIIHVRDAEDLALEILADFSDQVRGVWHCFSGNRHHLERALDIGLNIGVGGLATFKNSDRIDLLPHIPRDRLLLETDSPYLSPHPLRGKRNEPSNLPLVLSALAPAWKLTPAEAEKKTDAAARTLFSFSMDQQGEVPG